MVAISVADAAGLAAGVVDRGYDLSARAMIIQIVMLLAIAGAGVCCWAVWDYVSLARFEWPDYGSRRAKIRAFGVGAALVLLFLLLFAGLLSSFVDRLR